jgi:hypothetical protein
VLTTQVATVGDVDRTDGKLRQTKDEKFSYVAKFAEFAFDIHAAAIMRESDGLLNYCVRGRRIIVTTSLPPKNVEPEEKPTN